MQDGESANDHISQGGWYSSEVMAYAIRSFANLFEEGASFEYGMSMASESAVDMLCRGNDDYVGALVSDPGSHWMAVRRVGRRLYFIDSLESTVRRFTRADVEALHARFPHMYPVFRGHVAPAIPDAADPFTVDDPDDAERAKIDASRKLMPRKRQGPSPAPARSAAVTRTRIVAKTRPATNDVMEKECDVCRRERKSKALVANDRDDPRFADAKFVGAMAVFPNNDIKYDANKQRARRYAERYGLEIAYSPAQDVPSAAAMREAPSISSRKLQWLQRHDR